VLGNPHHTHPAHATPHVLLCCSYHFSLDDLKGVGPSFCRAIAAAWCAGETSTHLPLHPAIRQALADPDNPLVAACRRDGPAFVYPPPPSAYPHAQPRKSAAAAAAAAAAASRHSSGKSSDNLHSSGKTAEDEAQSHSSESRDEQPEAQVVVRLPPPRADVNFTPVFALSLSLLQQAAAAAAAMSKATKVEPSLIDCIPGFEIVRLVLLLLPCAAADCCVQCCMQYNTVRVTPPQVRGFVEDGRGIDSECGSDSDGGKDGVCLDTSDDEEMVVKVGVDVMWCGV